MQSTTQNETDKPSLKVEFLQFHKPALEDGDYEITVTQEIEIKERSSQNIPKPPFTKTQKFSVLGDRFSLNPQDIHAVFPPAGSLGEHSNVLPHIIFNRSTLPWERMANNDKSLPWLALLLFEGEDEKPTPKIRTISQLKDESKNPKQDEGKFPKILEKDEKNLPEDSFFLQLEIGQHDDDKITVIDVQQELLKTIMPKL